MLKLNDTLKIVVIDQGYMRALYNACSEVFFSPVNYDNKPYVGILISDAERKYAIPLTSAKPKHLSWANYSNGKMLVYETVSASNLARNDVATINPDGTAKHVLSALMINKMIPLKAGYYSVVNINPDPLDSQDVLKYKQLLNKEYAFCVSNKDKIVKEANKIYSRQMATGTVFFGYCDFKKLEEACDNYR